MNPVDPRAAESFVRSKHTDDVIGDFRGVFLECEMTAVMYSETDDVDAYRNFTQSPDVARAMEEDGVERDTVKVYALEKDLIPS